MENTYQNRFSEATDTSKYGKWARMSHKACMYYGSCFVLVSTRNSSLSSALISKEKDLRISVKHFQSLLVAWYTPPYETPFIELHKKFWENEWIRRPIWNEHGFCLQRPSGGLLKPGGIQVLLGTVHQVYRSSNQDEPKWLLFHVCEKSQ